MSGIWLALMGSQCWSGNAHGCNCSAKKRFWDVCHGLPSCERATRRLPCHPTHKRIELHCRKFHHAILSICELVSAEMKYFQDAVDFLKLTLFCSHGVASEFDPDQSVVLNPLQRVAM
jgi:hypothetical protein